MAIATVEERLTRLEEKVAQLTGETTEQITGKETNSEIPWWEQLYGSFKDSPDYEAAMRLGAAYRKAQPNAADNPEAVEF